MRDIDLAVHNALDSRRLEVVADGLTLCRGGQLATDTTVSLCRTGPADPGQLTSVALEVARRRMEASYPELSGEGGRAPRCPGS